MVVTKMKYFWIFLFAAVFLCGGLLTAQDVQFTASVNKNPVAVGETFQVTFSLNTDGNNFRPPDFRGFNVTGGPYQSQSTQIMNGQMSKSFSFTYALKAKSKGKYTIGPAYINVDGDRIKSSTVDLEVVEKGATAESRRAQSIEEKAEKFISENVFMRLIVDRTNVREGEQISAAYKLYVNSQLELRQFNVKTTPAFNGFWVQDIDMGDQNWQTEKYKGVIYRTHIIQQNILIPQISGELEVPPFEADLVVPLRIQDDRRRGLFFDNYKNFDYTAKSNSATVNVKPLPSGSPESFTGAVGDFQIESWFDKTETKTGDPITLKIKITGKGNLPLINTPDIQFPPGWDSYDPKITDSYKSSAGGISGSRIFEYLSIPANTGNYKIGPVKFSWYDTGTSEYREYSSEVFNIHVEKGEGGIAQDGASGVSREELQYLGKDIRYIKNDIELKSKASGPLFGSAAFYVFSLLPLFLFVGLVIYRRRRSEMMHDTALLKNRKASSTAKKRLAQAGKHLSAGEDEKFYEEVSKAIWGYLHDKLNIPFAALNKDSAGAALKIKDVSEEEINELKRILDECEYARFAPDEGENKMAGIYESAAILITKLEGRLK
ncbi:MAG: BatD family protein [Candidatus Kapaibacterium sp.]